MFEKVFRRLGDMQSEQIFEARMLYSVTGDYKYIQKIVEMTSPAKLLRQKQKNHRNSSFVIWGAGFLGGVLVKSFSDINWEAFIDNIPSLDEIDGIPVFGSDIYAEKYRDAIVVIASVGHYEEIVSQILSYGILAENIINIGKEVKQMLNRQYFDLPELYHVDQEVFVDAGFFDGTTTVNFTKWANGKYKQIIGFEPDYLNYRRYVEIHDKSKKLLLLNSCVWNEDTMLGFSQNGKSSAAINMDCEHCVEARTIDGTAKDYPVSFIKMDIEGAEKEALLGARGVIRKYKPKLAICVYHKKEDIWEIPELIMSLNPEYRFWLRHYSLREAETVLYAL